MDYSIGKKGWFPAAATFGEAISPVSNYPEAYLYGVFLALSGHVIGRRAYVRYATALYPNFYVCLVGPSGIAHKSTAINLSIESLGDLADKYHRLPGVTTSQGLLLAMSNSNGQALLCLDELAAMLTRKRQDFAADLMSCIVELYACPKVAGTYTRRDPIEVAAPFLTLIASSTVEWLRAGLTSGDLMAGFGNRMTFILGDPRKDVEWPRVPSFEDLDWIKLESFTGQVKLHENAVGCWSEFYAKFTARQKIATPFIRVLAERIPEKILKTALLIAAWSDTHIIEDTTLEQAIDWGKYLYRCVEKLSPNFEAVERQVLAAIDDGYNTRPTLFGALSHVFQATQIRTALDNLRWLGLTKEAEGKFVRLELADRTMKQ
jgi:hypothetical protein